MQVYRELIFNNIAQFVRTGFPVLCGLLGAARVDRLVRDFIARHRAETPYFLEISREFLAYLQQEYEPEAGDPDYLIELAHYEWVELALDVAATELPGAGIDPAGDLLRGRPVLSPLAWSLCYTYPVHRLSPEFQPATPPPQPTYLVVYRNRADQVRFLEINAVTARLLQLLMPGSGPEMTGSRRCAPSPTSSGTRIRRRWSRAALRCWSSCGPWRWCWARRLRDRGPIGRRYGR